MSEINKKDIIDAQGITEDIGKVTKELESLKNEIFGVANASKTLDKQMKSNLQTQEKVKNTTKEVEKNTEKLNKTTLKVVDINKELQKFREKEFKERQKQSAQKVKLAEKEAEAAKKAAEKELQAKLKAADKAAEKIVREAEKERKAKEKAAMKAAEAREKAAEKERKAQKKLEDQTKENIRLINTEAKSVDELKAQNKALTAERNKLDTTTEEGQATIKDYNSRIDQNNELIEQNANKEEKRRFTVGKYREELEGLFPAFGKAGAGAEVLTQGAGKVNKAFLKLLKNPVILILSAIALAIAAITKAIQKFQPLTDKLEQSFAGIAAVGEVFATTLGKIGKVIIGALVVDFLKLRASILKVRIAFFEFIGNTEKAAELGQKLEKVNKDLAESQAQLKEDIDDTADSLRNFGDAANYAFTEGQKLKNLEQNTERLRIRQIKTNAELQKSADLYASIADDATRSFDEREKAAIKARNAEVALAANVLKLAKQQEGIEKQRAANITRNRALVDKETEVLNTAIANRLNAQQEYNRAVLDSDRRISELKQDRLERDLDFEVDIIDKRLQAVLQGATDETRTLEDRQKSIEAFTEVYDKAVERQVGIIEQFTKTKIDLDDLQNESDISVLTQKVRNLGLSEIIEGRLLEILRDRIDAQRDLLQAEKDLNKESVESRKETSQKIIDGFQRLDTAQNILYQNRLKALKESLIQGEIEEEEYSKRVMELNLEQAQAQIDNLKALSQSQEISVEERQDLLEKIADAENALLDQQIDNAEKSAEAVKKSEAEKQKAIEDRINASIDAGNEAFNLFKALQDRELASLEEQKAYELSLVSGNAEAEAAIERRYADEIAKIRRKQAISDKAQALFNVAINTAQGITAALASLPPNPALAALIGVIGGLQAATIIATPIPQFDKGSGNTPDTYIAGEKRPEIRIHDGKAELVTQPTLFTGAAGDQIISGAITDRMLNHGLLDSMALNGMITQKKAEDLNGEKLDRIYQELRSRKDIDIMIDRRGISRIYKDTKAKKTWIDKYFR